MGVCLIRFMTLFFLVLVSSVKEILKLIVTQCAETAPGKEFQYLNYTVIQLESIADN